MDIKSKVNRLVHCHKTRDPFEIIKGMNIILVLYPLEGVRGFYQYFQRNNIIYLDERLADSERRFVLAHELGHMLLHKKANAIFMDTRTHFNTDTYEEESNKFAMDLLLPDDILIEYFSAGYTLEQITRITGYHERLLELKIRDMNQQANCL